MKAPGEESERPSRADLEEEAERVRARLVSDIDELKRRGRRVADGAKVVRQQIKAHPRIALGVAAGATLVLGLVWRRRRAKRRRAERRDALLGLAARLLGPGYAMKPPEPRPSAVSNALSQAARELAVTAGREIGRRALLVATQAITGSVADGDGSD